MSDNSVRFGFTVPQRGALFGVASLPELVTLAFEAEDTGSFDFLWVGDSIFAKPRPSSFVMLAGLAARTQRITLGVGCMASFPIRDPIILAYEWGSLDLLSAGRMLLTVCTGIVAGGASAREGAHWDVLDRKRAARMEENIRILRRLFSEDDVSYEGEFRSFDNVTISPKPVQQPCPIWIASNLTPGVTKPEVARRVMQRVARMADGWMTTSKVPGEFSYNWSLLSDVLREEGQDPEVFPNIEYHNVNINTDKQAALEESGRFLDAYYGPVFKPEQVETWTAAGSPEQCIEHLNGLVRDGAKAITLRITSWNQREQLKTLVEDILPRVSGS